jgi:hypothetical protein
MVLSYETDMLYLHTDMHRAGEITAKLDELEEHTHR